MKILVAGIIGLAIGIGIGLSIKWVPAFVPSASMEEAINTGVALGKKLQKHEDDSVYASRATSSKNMWLLLPKSDQYATE